MHTGTEEGLGTSHCNDYKTGWGFWEEKLNPLETSCVKREVCAPSIAWEKY